MSEQELSRPTSREAWAAYWAGRGTPWRTEPEIDEARQASLAERRAVTPDIAQGAYPFKDIVLTRADVEWLLATHEHGRGPVDWNDAAQRSRPGLDVRGALLQRADLSALPLTRLIGGLPRQQREHADAAQREAAAVHLEGAVLYDAHLEDAVLSDAHLEGANLAGTFGHRTHLELVKLIDAHLEGADCSYAHMDEGSLAGVYLEGVNLYRAHLERTNMRGAHLAGANLRRAHLDGALLVGSDFSGRAPDAQELARIRQWAPQLPGVLMPTDLRGTFFDAATDLQGVVLGDRQRGFARVADLHWGDANAVTADWSPVDALGDEHIARQGASPDGASKTRSARLAEFEAAVRATRQVEIVLRGQGLKEIADRFAYRAQVLQRQVLLRQAKFLRYVGSLFLDLISGYGYKPLRSVLTYVLVIVAFAALFWCATNDVSLTHGLFTHGITALGMSAPPPSTEHLQGYEAVIVSMTSFHGRGFFQPSQSPGDAVAILAAAEAAAGLLLEIVLIATFTQRLFAR